MTNENKPAKPPRRRPMRGREEPGPDPAAPSKPGPTQQPDATETDPAIASISMRQQQAIEVLLVGGTDQQAADAAGVVRTTVTGWRNNTPAFEAAYNLARRDLLKRTSARMHAARTVAVKALEDVAKDTRHPGPRVSAARAIVELSHKAIELEELEARVEELEQSVGDRHGQG